MATQYGWLYRAHAARSAGVADAARMPSIAAVIASHTCRLQISVTLPCFRWIIRRGRARSVRSRACRCLDQRETSNEEGASGQRWPLRRRSPAPAAHRPQLKIGVAGPLTGPNAAFGAQLKNGAEQAVADINAAGGINGQKIELSFGDDAVRSQAGRVGRQQVRRRRRQVRRRPLQLRRHRSRPPRSTPRTASS